jgi:hypothetical protein
MTSPLTSSPLSSVSHSKLERLLSCPLRIAFEQTAHGRGHAPSSSWALVGLAVHRTLELLLVPNPPSLGDAWTQACDETMEKEGADPRAAPNARRARLRLERRLPDLLDFVGPRASTDFLPEETLTSPDGRVTGQIDLLLLGDRPVIIDHKAGLVLGDGVPKDVYWRQLALYAWLVEVALQVDVYEAALFSLRDGLVEVDVSRTVRTPLVAAAFAARDAYNDRAPGPQPATPSDLACGRCPFVGACDDAWKALADGRLETFGWGDAVRGEVTAEVTVAASGAAAVPLNVDVGTATGMATVIDVPAALVAECGIGDPIALWQLDRRSDEPLTLAWRDGVSSISVG